MTQISVQDVTISYEKRPVIRGLSFDIEAGDYLCIVGENGSGKTTLMKGLLGLLPLKSGSIRYGDGVKASQIGYLPQQTIIQRDFPASVQEVVLSGCLNRAGWKPFFTGSEKQRAAEKMEELGISHLKNRSYKMLSGGQQQRVALARTLAQNPQIILADEPVASLDPVTAKQVMGDFLRINKEMNITILLNIHHVDLALQYAGRVVGIRAGRIVYDGPATEVTQEILDEIYEGKTEEEPVG